MAKPRLFVRKFPSPNNFLITNHTVTQCFEGETAVNNNMPAGYFQAQWSIKRGEAYQIRPER